MRIIKELVFIVLLILLLLIFYIFLGQRINFFRYFGIFNKKKKLYNSKNMKKRVHFGKVEFMIVDKDIPVKDIFI